MRMTLPIFSPNICYLANFQRHTISNASGAEDRTAAMLFLVGKLEKCKDL
jgi:hypothetical protein